MGVLALPLSKIKERFTTLRRAYSHAFRSPSGNIVLADLAQFCRANDTCFDPDPRVHAAMEGRREVWLRIQEHLHLTPEQLVRLRTGHNLIEDGQQ